MSPVRANGHHHGGLYPSNPHTTEAYPCMPPDLEGDEIKMKTLGWGSNPVGLVCSREETTMPRGDTKGHLQAKDRGHREATKLHTVILDSQPSEL